MKYMATAIDMMEGLFGSKAKARLIRFFVLNPVLIVSIPELAQKNKLSNDEVRKTIHILLRIGLLIERSRQRKKYYGLNKGFAFFHELHNLFIASNRFPQCRSFKKIRQIGDVRLALISGIFLNHEKSKADMLLVVNNASQTKVNAFIENIEAEVGKEIRYVRMDLDEFKYRIEMIDRFLLDFFEHPHEEVINRIPNLKRFITPLKR